MAAVGESEGKSTGTAELSSLARTSTYARDPDDSVQARGFLTLVSDGTKLTGAYAVGLEAGDWLQQATLAVRAGVLVLEPSRRAPGLGPGRSPLEHAVRGTRRAAGADESVEGNRDLLAGSTLDHDRAHRVVRTGHADDRAATHDRGDLSGLSVPQQGDVRAE